MEELIKREDAIEAMAELQGIAQSKAELTGISKAWKRIKVLPTVDAVPVVRCEKCRHGIKAHGISDGWVLCSKPYVTDTVGNMMHKCDWFCADGDREQDE